MVNLTIDGKSLRVKDGTTILEAAKQIGVEIPTLCFLKDINEIGACRVCVVEVEGMERLVTSCNHTAQEGMVIHTNSTKVRRARKYTVQLMLSQHDARCVMCIRNGSCSFQKITADLNILNSVYKYEPFHIPWKGDFPLIRDSSKCIGCMRCVQVCEKIQGLGVWDLDGTGSRTSINVSGHRAVEESDCSLCGQCITHCPTGALSARDDTAKVWRAIEDPDVVTVAQIAPAVRASWGEALGLSDKEATVGRIIDALKRMGVDYVFDTTFSADLTIMEEGTEFIERYTKGELKDKPMFTSCCPGWIRFIKSQYPHLVPQLSTAKSPQQMFGSVMKTYFADKIGIDPEKLCTISVMPCSAKKGEANMELFHGEYQGHDVDHVLTTRELVRMIRSARLNPGELEDIDPDELMKDGSGAGVIFGATGGVMEAALRSAYYLLNGQNPDPDMFSSVRKPEYGDGIILADVDLGKVNLKVGVVSGLANTRTLIEKIESGELKLDFVEVMACPGGCSGGGGQIIHDGEELAYHRGQNLYFLDKNMSLRFSHENPDVNKLYEDYLEKPCSHKAHELLHTDHNAWEMPPAPVRKKKR